jgi:hypothetical protein
MNDTDPTQIFTKNDSGEWIHPDNEPYRIHPNEVSIMTYGQMREISTGIGKIVLRTYRRKGLRAEVRARLQG